MSYKYISESDAESMFDDFIDEIDGPVTILGMEYCASRVLKELDPIAYSCGLRDYLDSERLTTDESEADEDDGDESEADEDEGNA